MSLLEFDWERGSKRDSKESRGRLQLMVDMIWVIERKKEEMFVTPEQKRERSGSSGSDEGRHYLLYLTYVDADHDV